MQKFCSLMTHFIWIIILQLYRHYCLLFYTLLRSWVNLISAQSSLFNFLKALAITLIHPLHPHINNWSFLLASFILSLKTAPRFTPSTTFLSLDVHLWHSSSNACYITFLCLLIILVFNLFFHSGLKTCLFQKPLPNRSTKSFSTPVPTPQALVHILL